MPEVSDAQVDTLLEHLRAWLMAQPIWPVVLASSRTRRKAIAARVADTATRIPNVAAFVQEHPATAQARQVVEALGLEVKEDANRTDR